MSNEKMFKKEEAQGLLDVVKNYLLFHPGDLSVAERHGIGRLLTEIRYTWEVADDTPTPSLPPNCTRLGYGLLPAAVRFLRNASVSK